jgi:ECF transporter S component (folate family)
LKRIKDAIRSVGDSFRLSAKEMKNTRALVGVAMLCAINIVIGQFSITLSPTQKIGFSFLSVGVSGMLYGPVLTGMAGIINDLIKFLLKPTGSFMIGFTLIEGLQGMFYGLFLYRHKISLPRVFLTRLFITVLLNLVMTPFFLWLYYGNSFIVLVGGRLVKNLISLPITTAVQFMLLRAISEVPIIKAMRARTMRLK